MYKSYNIINRFIARHNYRFDMEQLNKSNILFDLAEKTTKIKILRPCLWFYNEQIITISDLEKYYTHDAIVRLEVDKFIEIYK